MHNLKPMDAVAALYSNDDPKLSAAIMASLSQAIFHGDEVQPAGRVKRALARISHRVLDWTTRTSIHNDAEGREATKFSNRLLEQSGHPYAKSLLTSSGSEVAALVEGGDSMNGPYMMLAPEIKKNCGLWDRLFFDSVQSRDVQSRIVWETRACYESAKMWLERKEPVRLKAVAAGTGLSLMLVYDKLIRDGFNPELITARITDRDQANINKANRLLETLAASKDNNLGFNWKCGITAVAEDIFAGIDPGVTDAHKRYDVVTAIGILEYFQGSSYTTSEQRLRLETPAESVTAHDLVIKLNEMTSDRASLILNTYKDDSSTRILELFGKRFVYRRRENLHALLASVNFRPARLMGSGHIYDVEAYEKHP
ncbi:MAG: hypothetical protein K8R87_09620 [Verrucomicrobia bacterium]|nr:hypothetical protein [Verrucomicrobiota bacterium]